MWTIETYLQLLADHPVGGNKAKGRTLLAEANIPEYTGTGLL